MELTFEKALEVLEPLVPPRITGAFEKQQTDGVAWVSSVLARAPLHTLDAGALVALLIAHERRKGSASPWWPYLSALPETVSCAWALPVPQYADSGPTLSFVLYSEYRRARGIDTEGWPQELDAAQRYLNAVAQGMCQDYGEYLGITPDDVIWGIGIMSSRGYGGELRPGLVPYIDMVNHNARSTPFIWTDANLDQQALYAVWSVWDDEPRPLQAGDEVYVDYKFEGLGPLDAFMSHGFVPQEM
eukprot:7061498-Pyramimonas_sp.AAC.1